MASQPAPEPIELDIPQQIPRVVPPEQASLAALLQFEAEVRRQPTEAELVYHVANESRRIVAYDQMFVLRHARIGDGYHVIAASSIAVVDRNAPLISLIEATVSRMDVSEPRAFDASDDAQGDDALEDYPFHAWYWQPMRDAEGTVFAGLPYARARFFALAALPKPSNMAGARFPVASRSSRSRNWASANVVRLRLCSALSLCCPSV
jgi:hypothetical protein